MKNPASLAACYQVLFAYSSCAIFDLLSTKDVRPDMPNETTVLKLATIGGNSYFAPSSWDRVFTRITSSPNVLIKFSNYLSYRKISRKVEYCSD